MNVERTLSNLISPPFTLEEDCLPDCHFDHKTFQGPDFGGEANAARRRPQRQEREDLGGPQEVSHRSEEGTGDGEGKDGQAQACLAVLFCKAV